MGIRRIGYSDLGYFYRGVGDLTRNLMMDMDFRETVDQELLVRAIGKALDDHPEFAVQPLRDGTSFVYREQERGVPVLPMDDSIHYFGTEETGGYLFCVRAGEKKVRFSVFHGLTDGKGCLGFYRTVLYYYGQGKGISFSMANPGQYEPLDKEDQFDPFGKYATPAEIADAKKSSADSQDMAGKDAPILILPKDDFLPGDPRVRSYDLEFSAPEFLRLTKEIGTSASSLLTAVMAEALDGLYGGEGKAILSFLPVNMLKLFGSRTRVNFNLVIPLLLSADMLKDDLPAKCRAVRSQMDRQIDRERFSKIMWAKVEETRRLEKGKPALFDATKKPAITYTMTYPGKADIDEEFLPLIDGWHLSGWAPVVGCAMLGYSQGEKMIIHLGRRSDSDAIPKALQEKFGKLGLTAKITDKGYKLGDRLLPEKLESR